MKTHLIAASLITIAASLTYYAFAQAEPFQVPDGFTCTTEMRPKVKRDKTAPGNGILPPGYRLDIVETPVCKKTKATRA